FRDCVLHLGGSAQPVQRHRAADARTAAARRDVAAVRSGAGSDRRSRLQRAVPGDDSTLGGWDGGGDSDRARARAAEAMKIYLAYTVRGDRGGVLAGRAICARLQDLGHEVLTTDRKSVV